LDNDLFKIPKLRRPVTLWVHPEGRVLGHIFLREQSAHHAGPETPLDALNQCEPFLVFSRDKPEEICFYSRKSIVRVEYAVEPGDIMPDWEPLYCQLSMMDGALIAGSIQEPLPPDRSRLLDYLNRASDCFIKIHMDANTIYLINKSYINHVHVGD
jgi:hypothetical protein